MNEMWDDDEDSYTEDTYYQNADEESDDEDWFGNLAGMAEDETMKSGDDEMMDAMVAYWSAKRRPAATKKQGQRGVRPKGSGGRWSR